MNRLIAIFLCILLVFPATALAQPSEPSASPDISRLDLGNFTILKEGQESPFAGFLFDQESVARLLAETEFAVLELKLRHDFELNKSDALWELKLSNVTAAKESLQTQHDSLMKIKDEEISRLREISLDQPNDYSHWWLAGGVVVGILLSVSVFYAAAEGFKD